MAKVKITGHASGTGVVTVTAPNTSTDRTITLPDATDTLIGTATTDALTTRINAGGRKNMVINGAMNVSQRGDFTTASSASTQVYYLDRFKTGLSVVTANKQHKLNQSVDGTLKNTLACTVTGAGTGFVYQYQQFEIEDMKKHHGKTLTASCWIKSNNNAFGIILYDNNSWIKGVTNTSSGSWQKITYTFTCNSSSSSSFTLGVSNFGNGAAGSALAVNDYFEFTDLQLEVGSVATDFEHRSYGEELALCQRYYQILVDGGADKAIGIGFYWSSTEVDYTHRFVTDMRASPTLEQVTGTDYYRVSANNDSFDGFSGIQYLSTRSCNMYVSANVSGTAGFASDIRSRNAASFIAFTAEL